MRKYTLDLFLFVRYPALIFLAGYGFISWWIVLVVVLIEIKVEHSWIS